MKMRIDPTVVYRIPKFSYKAKLADCWEELKQSIAHSSPDFYQQIQSVAANELGTLDERSSFTIWKYFNRSKFRATPYASFAGVGICKADYDPKNEITINDEQILHRFHDWKQTETVHIGFEDLLGRNATLVTNSSYYIIGNIIRYIDRIEGNYELAEQPVDEFELTILKACQSPVAINELILQYPDAIADRKIHDTLWQMIDDQLLLTELQPALIGGDYFQRLGFNKLAGNKEYIIAERPLANGKLNLQPFRHIPALVEKLHELLPSYRSTDMEQFINRFSKKFGERQVPVMEALDPELGIGYGNMESSGHGDPLLEQLLKNKKQADSVMEPPDTIAVLFSNIIGKSCAAIDLETIENTKGLKNQSLPNSLPVLCSAIGEQVYLEHMGGSTTNMLLGRFSLADDAIHKYCRSIAQAEQEANPDVLFFDIAYEAGGVVDNVNRRQRIYDWQLSILNHDASKSPLVLNDLYLSVLGGNLILHSKALNKRLIPRMASAYNYQLSDLPLFRMLCDLQHQDTHKNLYLRLRDRLPGLTYYPKVYYRNIILSPQTWRVDSTEVGNTIGQLRDMLRTKGVPGFIKTGNADQTLSFDITSDEDLQFLLQQIKKHRSVYLEETEKPAKTMIRDQSGNQYMAQFIFNLVHDIPLFTGVQPESFSFHKPVPTPPGGQWLYFEIYCHAHRADQLLIEVIAPFIKQHRIQIIRWFFIRYTENGHHLRLRLMLHHPEYGQTITALLSKSLENYLNTGLVSDLQIRTYKREAERYGIANLPAVEHQFCIDSDYVLLLLKKGISTMRKYKCCMDLFQAIGNSGIFSGKDFLLLIDQQLDGFSKEQDLQPPHFKILNASYKDLLQLAEPVPDRELVGALLAMKDHWIMTLSLYPSEQRATIFTALFHMHVNRLFSSEQRLRETIIYYFLQKSFKRLSAWEVQLHRN